MNWKKRLTIKQHFFFFSALNIIAVVLAIAIISRALFESAITEKAKTFQQREVTLVGNQIELLIRNINDYVLTLSVDETVQRILRNYEDVPDETEKRYNIRQELMRAVYAKSALNSYIDFVAVLSVKGTFFDSGSYSEEELKNIIDKNQIDLKNMRNKPIWYGPIEVENNLIGKETVFVVGKPVVDIWSPDTLGYLFAVVRESTISAFYQNVVDINSKMYVANQNGEIISSSDKSSLYKRVDDLDFSQKEKDDYVETTCVISKNQWKVMNFVPREYLVREMDRITLFMIDIGIVAVLVSFLISYLLAGRVTKPIHKLAEAMKYYDFTRKYGHVEEVSSSEELHLLTRRFNQMVDRVEDLMKEIELENQQKRVYELRLIQEQVKPHFLYNSLETIISLIGIAMDREAIKYTKIWGIFYRISLNGGNDIITLKEELEMTQNYLYMQGIRYVDKLDYKIGEIPEELVNCKIPKLTLQPIVENAIYHGIKPKRYKSLLRISCFSEEEEIFISIYDNGVGMSRQQLKEIWVKKGMEESGGFGLQSIDDRLKLVFGEQYGIWIESEQGVFTEVRVKIPKKSRWGYDVKNING